MKKGITGDMLFWFMIFLIGVITIIIIAVFIMGVANTFDRPPGEHPLIQSALYPWLFFKLRKQN